MAGISEHKESRFGHVELHHRLADRHLADAALGLGDDHRIPRLLLRLVLEIELYGIVARRDGPPIVGIAPIVMAFQAPLVAPDPAFEPLERRVGACIGIPALPVRFEYESAFEAHGACGMDLAALLLEPNVPGNVGSDILSEHVSDLLRDVGGVGVPGINVLASYLYCHRLACVTFGLASRKCSEAVSLIGCLAAIYGRTKWFGSRLGSVRKQQ